MNHHCRNLLLFWTIAVVPMAAHSLSSAAPPQPVCEVVNPCASESPEGRQACAESRADWIVEGRFRTQGGVLTVEPATPVRGNVPLLPYRDGKFYLWRSCWKLSAAPDTLVRAYGLDEQGIFHVARLAAASSCPEISTTSPQYTAAVNLLMTLPEVSAWVRHVEAHPPAKVVTAFGETARQMRIDRHCHVEVTLFSDEGTYLHRWMTFEVDAAGHSILVQDDDGNPVPLKTWRQQAGSTR